MHNDVNMICWFGRDFAAWDGICPPDVFEEEWVCLRMPHDHGCRIHEACGRALCVHYASVFQCHAFDEDRSILDRYYALMPPTEIDPEPAPVPLRTPMR